MKTKINRNSLLNVLNNIYLSGIKITQDRENFCLTYPGLIMIQNIVKASCNWMQDLALEKDKILNKEEADSFLEWYENVEYCLNPKAFNHGNEQIYKIFKIWKKMVIQACRNKKWKSIEKLVNKDQFLKAKITEKTVGE